MRNAAAYGDISVLLYILLGVVGLWILGAIAGVGKNTIFRNPASLSDAQIERTIRLSARIMDNSRIGSKEWRESGDKFQAAYREQCRRRGIPYVDPADRLTLTRDNDDEEEKI